MKKPTDYFVNQKDLAILCGVAESYISKLKKDGLFNLCIEKRKMIRECAKNAFKNRPQDASRDNQREANQAKKPKALIEEQKFIDQETPPNIKSGELYVDDNLNELAIYTMGVKSQNQKMQITKDFWGAKIAQQKYELEQGKLIRIEDVTTANQTVTKAIRDKMLSLPQKLAPLIASTDDPNEIHTILTDAINEALSDLVRLS